MISETKKKILEYFAQGRKYYKLMKFEEAKGSFARALSLDSEDGPSKVYFLRCKHYIENPPPDDWDGVFIMETK